MNPAASRIHDYYYCCYYYYYDYCDYYLQKVAGRCKYPLWKVVWHVADGLFRAAWRCHFLEHNDM